MGKRWQWEGALTGDPERVVALLSGTTWAEVRAAVLRDGTLVVERTVLPDGGVRTTVTRELPPGGPGALRALLPKDGRVVQTEEWGPTTPSGRQGRWELRLPGTPAQVTGTSVVEPRDGGSRYSREGTVDVPLPLLRGRAETFVAEMLTLLAVKEAGLLEEELRRS